MIEISGTTSVCGLIGNPVAHSNSPLIHNRLAELMGIDMSYVTFKVEHERIADAVKGAYALDILGMNVTVPHKQSVIENLVDIDPLANAIGAVNTLVKTKDGYKGYNTDIIGLDRELKENDIDVRKRNVVILGAGGASRAICFLCAKNGAENILLLNRTLSKADDIAQSVNTHFNRDVVKTDNIANAHNIDLENYIVIQTTSVGLHPNDDISPVGDGIFYEKAAAGVDIIYNPGVTKFMKLMNLHGKKAYSGLKMLLYQAVASFELWNQCSVEQKYIDIVYEDLKRKLGINE